MMVQKMKLVDATETASPRKPKAAKDSIDFNSLGEAVADKVEKILFNKVKLSPEPIRIMHGSDSNRNGMFMAEISTPLPTNVKDVRELIKYLQNLDKFTHGDYSVVVDGRTWIIGDGDDSFAVKIFNGNVRIWLRHFEE